MPDLLPSIRIYVDSNVLFSASYSDRNRLLQFWHLRNVSLVVSSIAITESIHHARRPDHAARLQTLLSSAEVVSNPDARRLPKEVILAAKDRPILTAAIAAKVNFLVTGDKNHFRHLYGTTVGGVYISAPTDLLSRLKDRIIL